MADTEPGTGKPYHHGNLRQALVEATLGLIEERGPLGFTLAEAARVAGVSAAAPYRHFRGRDELIEEVARQGFVMFTDRLERAWNEGRPSGLSAFMAMGRAYLGFARDNPGYYMAMFESGVAIAGNPDLALAADRAMSVLVRAAERLGATCRPGSGRRRRWWRTTSGRSRTAWSSSSAAAAPAPGRRTRPTRCWRAARSYTCGAWGSSRDKRQLPLRDGRTR
jgi:AcrR family transcriptional regulator